MRLIENTTETHRLTGRSFQLAQLARSSLVFHAGAGASANNIQALLLVGMTQQRGASIAAIAHPDRSNPIGERGFQIGQEDLLELVLTAAAAFLPGILEGVNSQW